MAPAPVLLLITEAGVSTVLKRFLNTGAIIQSAFSGSELLPVLVAIRLADYQSISPVATLALIVRVSFAGKSGYAVLMALIRAAESSAWLSACSKR